MGAMTLLVVEFVYLIIFFNVVPFLWTTGGYVGKAGLAGQVVTKYGTEDKEDYKTASTVREVGNFLSYVAMGLFIAEIPRLIYTFHLIRYLFCGFKARDTSWDRNMLVIAMNYLLLNLFLSAALMVIIIYSLGGDFNSLTFTLVMNYVVQGGFALWWRFDIKEWVRQKTIIEKATKDVK